MAAKTDHAPSRYAPGIAGGGLFLIVCGMLAAAIFWFIQQQSFYPRFDLTGPLAVPKMQPSAAELVGMEGHSSWVKRAHAVMGCAIIAGTAVLLCGLLQGMIRKSVAQLTVGAIAGALVAACIGGAAGYVGHYLFFAFIDTGDGSVVAPLHAEHWQPGGGAGGGPGGPGGGPGGPGGPGGGPGGPGGGPGGPGGGPGGPGGPGGGAPVAPPAVQQPQPPANAPKRPPSEEDAAPGENAARPESESNVTPTEAPTEPPAAGQPTPEGEAPAGDAPANGTTEEADPQASSVTWWMPGIASLGMVAYQGENATTETEDAPAEEAAQPSTGEGQESGDAATAEGAAEGAEDADGPGIGVELATVPTPETDAASFKQKPWWFANWGLDAMDRTVVVQLVMWGLVGLAIGFGCGLGTGSPVVTIKMAAGGLIGGALGGMVIPLIIGRLFVDADTDLIMPPPTWLGLVQLVGCAALATFCAGTVGNRKTVDEID